MIIIPLNNLDEKPNLQKLIPSDGLIIVKGERGGNTHTLFGEYITYDEIDGEIIIDVKNSGWLIHGEHAAIGLAKGIYKFTQQREQRDIARRVQD